MRISYSRFDTYLRCPYAHYLRYYEKLESKYKSRPLSFGTDMHHLLQYRHDKKALKKVKKEIGDTFYDLSAIERDKLGGDDYLVDLATIFSDYMTIYADHPKPKYTEREFKVKINVVKGEPIYFIGLIDETYVTTKRQVYLGEHKTFGRRPDLNTLVMNTQKCLYAKAYYLKSGRLPERVIWDHICSTPAAEPIWLESSGRFSMALNKKITPFSYLRACDRMDIDDESIRRGADKYKDNIPEFFFKTDMDIIPSMVDLVWDGFMYTARDIVRQGHKNKTRRLCKDCSWCDFRDICNAELSGFDAKDIIARNYTQRDRED